MNKKARFVPSSSNEAPTLAELSQFSEDEVMHARAQVEREIAAKKTRAQIFEEIWAIISTVFAIITTAILLAKNWVEGVLSYVILAVLCVYVLVFLVLCALLYKKPTSKVPIATYGKIIKLVKALTNIAFLVLSAMSLAGIAASDLSPSKWVVLIGNFLLAGVKLGFALYSIIKLIVRHHVAKNYALQVTRIVDGKVQKKTAADLREEKKYR